MDQSSGNLERVRSALHGITCIAPTPIPIAPSDGPDRYLVMARMNRELDTVDSLRRNHIPAWWPSYETLVATRATRNGRQTRKLRRVGILPGYIFSDVVPGRDLVSLLHRIVGAIDVARTDSGKPLLINDADVQIIDRIAIGQNETPRSERYEHNFKVGEKVCFRDDLIGRWPPGRVAKLAPDGRISVEVDLMGRQVPVWVLPYQIERM